MPFSGVPSQHRCPCGVKAAHASASLLCRSASPRCSAISTVSSRADSAQLSAPRTCFMTAGITRCVPRAQVRGWASPQLYRLLIAAHGHLYDG